MSTTTGGILKASADKKNVKPAEFIWYLIAVFFYTNMTGFVGQYRNVFLVDVVQIGNKQPCHMVYSGYQVSPAVYLVFHT